ncbi:MAG: hypothetical protein WCE46_08835 [Methanoregula sp.]|jgi:hypothetical protein|uniref:hypothetical protein n=1 Tax=Methanoregula sp. TaxID=2052170 RepID=UPI003C76D081
MAQAYSHSTKLWVTALVAVIIIAGLTALAYTSSDAALKSTAQFGLKSTAGVMATQINASEIQGLIPGDENSMQYLAIAQKLRTMRSMNDHIINAYIITVNTTDKSATFLVDDLYPVDPSGSARIGQADTSPDKMQIFAALSGPTVSPQPYSDSWGSFMSAYAPIDDSLNDSNGNTVAVLGIDVAAGDYVTSTSQGTWIIVTGVVSIIIVLGALYVFGRKPEDAPKIP